MAENVLPRRKTRSSPPQLCSITPWIKAFHQGQEKKATAIVLVAASEPADGTIFLRDVGCIMRKASRCWIRLLGAFRGGR